MTFSETTEPDDIDVRSQLPQRRGIAARILSQGRARVGLTWILIVLAASVMSIWYTPHDPLGQNLGNALEGPSLTHLLGTDQLGRDLLSRLMYGAGDTLIGAALATGIALLIGVPLGVMAGYTGGWLDIAMSRLADLLLTIPAIIVLLTVLALFGNSMNLAMVALGVLMASQFIRIARASALAVRTELFVDAARVFGIGDLRIIFRHVLPNIGAPIIVQGSVILSVSILMQSSLGFLGMGTRPPWPSWGQMVAEASQHIYTQPWLMVPAGAVIMITIFAFTLVGDAARDSLVEAEAVSIIPTRKMQRVDEHRRRLRAADEPPAATIPQDVVVSIEDLTVTFPAAHNEVQVVRGATFRVRRGKALAIVGESGSGKTMTALSILGLVPSPGFISRGRILFEGKDLTAISEQEYRDVRGKRVGYISQEPMTALDPSFKVKTHLREVLQGNRGLSRQDADRRALELLSLVELPNPDDVYNSYAHQLSGGMAQRVAIAWALAGEPELLIADEPTTALDVTVQASILDLLRKLMSELDMTIILLTHDLGVVADLCDEVVVMQHGSVVEKAQVDTLFQSPSHPYSRSLLGHAQALDPDAGGPPSPPAPLPLQEVFE